MSAWTKQTAEKAYTDGARRFDAWFYAKPKAEQEMMREKGIVPYREMPQPRHAFPIVKEHKAFSFDPWADGDRVETDTFYSREKVREFIARLLASLDTSSEPEVRLHMALVRLVLRTPDAMTNEQLGKLHGLSRQAVNLHVQKMRKTLGMMPEANFQNGNTNRKEGEACRIRLRKVEKHVSLEGRETKGIRKAKVPVSKGKEVVGGQKVERTKQAKTYIPKKPMER